MFKKKSLYDTYFDEQYKYSQIYGDKAIVFFQMGKFYDAYSNEKQGYEHLEELEVLLNIHYIRRDHRREADSNYQKPNQFGINCVSIKKNLTTLVENGYTIILFDQVMDDDENIDRKCIGVYSPGTFFSDRQNCESNYMICAYISEEKQLIGKNSLFAIGVTIIDVTIGSIIVHEFYSDKHDEKYGLDELVRIMQTYHPTEIIIYYDTFTIDDNNIKNIKLYIELDKYQNSQFYIYHKKKGTDKLKLLTEETFKISYQNNFLADTFELNSQTTLGKKLSPIEVLNLEQKSYIIISLIIILKYVAEHNSLLLKNLLRPEIYLHNKFLILGNNAIEQLNILNSNGLETYNKKIESVFDVVNKTSTSMGKRFLKQNLLNPQSQENKKIILDRYNRIDALLSSKIYKKIREELKKMYDIDRLHRKMAIGIISPNEFYRLNVCYLTIFKIIALIKNDNILKKMIDIVNINKFISFCNKYEEELSMDKIQLYNNINDTDQSFFNKGIYDDIDKIQDKITYTQTVFSAICEYFTNSVKKKYCKTYSKDIVSIESNERDGYYFTINKTNSVILKNNIKKNSKIRIVLPSDDVIKFSSDDIIFKPLLKGRTKIFIPTLNDYVSDLSSQTTKLTKLIKKYFVRTMVGYYSKYKNTLHNLGTFVAEIDFCVSGAIVADQYYYCKPLIPSTDTNIPCYFEARGLRHAIIERLCNETEYIPNDVSLGNVPLTKKDNTKKNGILLFGINWTGKSSIMKSIGIAIILAQIGYYVPAEKFVYEPYMALYARITGNDNIFKGLSSFALEMTELEAILMRTEKQGSSTLVIGDEICRGTEDISGRAIVASALVNLSECDSSFIFSSHLHGIQDIDEVKNLSNLRLYHLCADYDEINDNLIFNRKLKSGPGPSVYGLSVAKFLIKNKKFTSRAEKIKDKMLNKNITDLSSKYSNYNNKLLVNKCRICDYVPSDNNHKELETHHINFQKDCDIDGKIKKKPYLHKNKLYNLVILCNKCHKKVHSGKIIINEYIDTTSGPILEWKYNN